VTQDKILHLNKEEREIIKTLSKLQESAADSERALSLFRHYDKDNSGEIDMNGMSLAWTTPLTRSHAPRVCFPFAGHRNGSVGETNRGPNLSDPSPPPSPAFQDTFALYDVDGGGTIELEEFSHFLQQQHTEAATRIRDMTESLGTNSISSSCLQDSTRLVMVTDAEDESEVAPYLPPKTGTLKMEVSLTFLQKSPHSVCGR
jgi:Ca2+-binding EF-hand superfamily protein